MGHWHIADTQSTAVSTVSSEAKCCSIIISFVRHKREIFSPKTMPFHCRQKHVLGKKIGVQVERDQKAWAWKVDSRLCLSHFGQEQLFFLDSRYKVQDTRFVSAPNTPLICYQYLTDGLPMHCWHSINTIATDCWPMVDRWSVYMSVNTRPIQDQHLTDAQQILNNTQQKYRSSCRQTLSQYVDRYVVQNSTDMLTDTLVNTCHKTQDPY